MHDPNLRVFVVWEPVLATDWHAPGAAAVARIPDPRASQFWDRQHLLSQEIRRAAASGQKQDGVVWDFIALFPPEARWTAAYPTAQFSGRTVVRVIDTVARALSQLTARADF